MRPFQPDKKAEVDEALKEQNENVWWDAGGAIVAQLFGNTITLGWAGRFTRSWYNANSEGHPKWGI